MISSVRAMQYVLDMTINSKKPDDLVHKLPYKCNRIWPLVLWPLSHNLLTNIRKICTSRPGYSDDSSQSVKCVVVFLDRPCLTVNLYQLHTLISCHSFKMVAWIQDAWIPPKVEEKSRKFWNWTTDVLNIWINFWNIKMIAYGPNHMEF